jgi:peptidoglycan/LPS O-acetylase OafA/YrhL
MQRMLRQLTTCNVTIGDYLDMCVLPPYIKHCDERPGMTNATCSRAYVQTKATVAKAWTSFTRLNSKHHGPVEFHCGDHKVVTYSDGTIAVLAVTALLVFLAVLSESTQSWARRQVLERTNATRARSGSVNSVSSRHSLQDRSGRSAPLSSCLARCKGAMDGCAGCWTRMNSKILQAFCLTNNFETLFVQSDPNRYPVLDGLRSMSMLWIIFAHTSVVTTELGTDDQNAVALTQQNLPQQCTLGASLAIDTFFFQLGLLTTRVLLRRMQKKRKTFTGKDILTFLLLRWLRLTPLYAFVLFFFAYTVPMLGSGPVWYRMIRATERCATVKQWGPNLLYVNNFVPASFQKSCMSWSWYLACDMQFFFVGLLVLFVYIRINKKVGLACSVLLTVCGVTTGWWVLNKDKGVDAHDDFFDKPYSRVTPFAVGLLMGILLVDFNLETRYSTEDKMGKPGARLSTWLATVLMLGALSTIVAVMYVDYHNFQPNVKQWGFNEIALFQSFGRLAFSLAMAVVTWLCLSGNSRLVNWFLGLGVWEPMGKLTLSAYLLHPIIIQCYYFQQVVLFHFVPINRIVVFVAMAFMTYAVSVVLHLLVELPFAYMLRQFLQKLKHWRVC